MLKIAFNPKAVQAGQKTSAINAEPRLVANSTVGKFTITAPVSKALDIAVGENVMFLNNIDEMEKYVAERHPAVVEWAEANGIDLNTREGQEAAIAEGTIWYIAKGILQYNAKGEPLMSTVRSSKEDKLAYIEENGDELIKDAKIRAMLIERVGNTDATDDELKAAIDVNDIQAQQFHSATGSKTSSTSTATGIGLQLNFTDSAVWTALKANLGDNKKSKNRIFSVNLLPSEDENTPNPITVELNNGKEVVKVTAYPFTFVKDEDPINRFEK